jgi:hypothetical protein
VTDYPEEAALEAAIVEAVRSPDEPDAIIVGWVIGVAYTRPGFDDRTGYAYYAPSGQPLYATRGLLDTTRDHVCASGDDE